MTKTEYKHMIGHGNNEAQRFTDTNYHSGK